jgi:hypothetical protein
MTTNYNASQHTTGRRQAYTALLQSPQWKLKRKQVIMKDKFRCQKCACMETITIDNVPFANPQLVGTYAEEMHIFGMERKDNPVTFHVHHPYYVLERNPWEYTTHELQTLCHDCHRLAHKNDTIYVFVTEVDKQNGHISDYTICNRCDGEGYFHKYNHVQHGICFKCYGARFLDGKDIPMDFNPKNKWELSRF